MSLPELLEELSNDASHISRFILAAGMRRDGITEIAQVQPVASAAPSYSGGGNGSYSESKPDSNDGW